MNDKITNLTIKKESLSKKLLDKIIDDTFNETIEWNIINKETKGYVSENKLINTWYSNNNNIYYIKYSDIILLVGDKHSQKSISELFNMINNQIELKKQEIVINNLEFDISIIESYLNK